MKTKTDPPLHEYFVALHVDFFVTAETPKDAVEQVYGKMRSLHGYSSWKTQNVSEKNEEGVWQEISPFDYNRDE